MTNITTINRVCEHLEKYVFDKVWNDPYTEYRTFIQLENLEKVATTGIFFGRYSQIQLPSEKVAYTTNKNSFFYVYAVPATYFRSLRLSVLEWVRLDEFCTDNLIDVEVFSTDGRRCSRAGVFLRQADMNDCIIVAIERNAFKRCFGDNAKPDDVLYFGKFFDSDQKPSVKYECFRLSARELPANQKSGTKIDPITKTGVPTYTMYDGRLLTGDYMNVLGANAFIEKVYDENIVGIFDVNTDIETAPCYTTGSGQRRLLIHIPKSLNPDHVAITPNTCDLYLVPTKMKEGAGHPEVQSVYLYQCGRSEHFHQITHNDFGIDWDWLVDMGSSFGFEEFYVKVLVRSEMKAKKAIRDANYINILYIHSDDEIVAFLLGKSDYQMKFWTAQVLEDNAYAKSLLRRRYVGTQCPENQCLECEVAGICPDKPNTSTICPAFSRRKLNEYIDIIGYYHTLALIGKRVTHLEVTSNHHGNNIFSVRAPLALSDLDAFDFVPIVYHNGLRVEQSKVRFLADLSKFHPELKDLQHCNLAAKELTFTPDATWWTKVIDVNYAHKLWIEVDETFEVGDKVVIEIFDHRHNGSVRHFKVPRRIQNYILTKDEKFSGYKHYFVKVGVDSQQFASAKINSELIGKPIDGTEYDVGIEGEDGQPVLFSEFYELESQFLIPMVTTDEWEVYRINEETDRENLVYYKIKDPGIFNPEMMTLDLDPKYAGLDLLVVEGPRTLENDASFDIDYHSTGILGKELWPTVESITEDLPTTHNFPLDNELVFLNKRRLIRGLDYTMEGYNPGDFHSGVKLYLQNVSWLQRHSDYQLIRTNQTTLSNQRGWIRGNIIQWNHQNPFWFDELSVLTIGGRVCSNIVHELGTITILDPQHHDNGLPYEFRMSVSTKVKKFLGDHGERTDHDKLEQIKAYFDSRYRKPDFITMVKKAYKIYSLYTEAIITDYVTKPEFDFMLTPAKGTFEEQFVDYTDWKDRDVAFTMSHEDFKYVDIYPIFNRLESIDRYQYYKINELARRLLPTDQYKHKDAANVK